MGQSHVHCQAEINEFDRPIRKSNDIGGLDIAMNQSLTVKVFQSPASAENRIDCIHKGGGISLCEMGLKRLTIKQFERHVKATICFPGIISANQIWMVEFASIRHFPEEVTFGCWIILAITPDDLKCHRAIEAKMLGFVHFPHAPFRNKLLHFVGAKLTWGMKSWPIAFWFG